MILVWIVINLILNFIPATLAYFGFCVIQSPDPKYWTIYWATWFLFTLPITLFNTLRAAARS